MATEPKEDEQSPEPPAPEVQPKDPDKVVVDLNDEPPEVGEPQKEPDRQTRRQQHRAMKEELRAKDERLSKMEKELAELRGAVQSRPQYVPQPVYQQRQEPADPYEEDISAISDQQEAINMAIANPKLADEKVQRLTAQWNKLERQKQELVTERILKRQGVGQGQQQGADPYQMQVAMLQAQFPEVFNSEVNRKAADLEYTRMVAAGRPATFTTAVEAAQRVRDQSTKRRPAPDDSEKSRYTSVPSRAGGSAGGQNLYAPSKLQLVNARAMYGHLDIPDEDRVKLWIKNVGQKEGLVKNGA